MPPKKKFFVTFGQISPFRDGWVEVEASDHGKAIDEATEAFGRHYSNVYDADQWDAATREMYPDGKLGRTLKAY